MNLKSVIVIICLYLACHIMISPGQDKAIAVTTNTIRFNLPIVVLNDHGFRLGIDRYDSPKIVIDSTLIIDFVFKYLVGGEIKTFIFDESDQMTDYIIPEEAGRNSSSASFNLVFAGIKPSEFVYPYYFEPNKFLESPDLFYYFQDMVMTLKEPFNIFNPFSTYLCLIRLKNKNGEIYNEDFYEKYNRLISLKTRYLLLFWDTLNYKETPVILNNCEPISKQLLCFDPNEDFALVSANEAGIERDTVITVQDTGIFISLYDQTAYQDLPLITTVNFNGDYPDSLLISYELYDISGKKIYQENQALIKYGIDVHGNLPAKPLMTDFLKLVILKPRGYNIFAGYEGGEYNWKENEYVLKIRDTNAINLYIEKIPSFDFFYLDVSSLKKRNLAISDIDSKIGEIVKTGTSFCIYVSFNEIPLTAKNGDEYSDVLRNAISMNADLPNPKIDNPNILEIVNWKEITRTNKTIKFHFYLSRPTYDIYSKQLIVDLLYQIGNKRWEVYIYSDSELKQIIPANNNYHYINLNKL